MGPFSRFVLVVLAAWRVTHLLAREDGPARCAGQAPQVAGLRLPRQPDGLLLLHEHLGGCSDGFLSQPKAMGVASLLACSFRSRLLARTN